MRSLILYTASEFLLYIILAFSFWVLFRGHNSPGGGFIAGLITASAFALHLITQGSKKTQALIKFKLPRLLAVGLSISFFCGLSSFAIKKPFLSSIWFQVKGVSFGTPLLFDIGIYLVIVSSILMIIIALEETKK